MVTVPSQLARRAPWSARRCALALALCASMVGLGAYAQQPLALDQALRLAQERSRQLAAQDAGAAAIALPVGESGQRHANPMPTILFQGDAEKWLIFASDIISPCTRCNHMIILIGRKKSDAVQRRGYARTAHPTGKRRPW